MYTLLYLITCKYTYIVLTIKGVINIIYILYLPFTIVKGNKLNILIKTKLNDIIFIFIYIYIS